jgi:putative FmdB family regulatory protein
MPTYGYRCENGHEVEVVQRISDPPLTECQICGAPVRRIFYPVGIVFKGPGFYKTDSRGSSSSVSSSPSTGENKADKSADKGGDTGADKGSGKADSAPKSETKGDSPPAPKPEKKSA